MSEHGGARPGAGRKPKAETYASEIARAERKIADRLPEIVDKLLTLAAGVTVREVDRDGGVDVYEKPPDFKAASYLVDRILGKPTQAVEVAGDDGGPLKVVIEYADPQGVDPPAASVPAGNPGGDGPI